MSSYLISIPGAFTAFGIVLRTFRLWARDRRIFHIVEQTIGHTPPQEALSGLAEVLRAGGHSFSYKPQIANETESEPPGG